MSHDRLLELCPIYAVGALDGEERRELESHLASGCAICEEQVRQYSEVTALLPIGLPDKAPSADLKSRLLAQLEPLPSSPSVVERKAPLVVQKTQPAKRSGWLPWACAVAAGLALAVSIWNISELQREFANQRNQWTQQRDQQQQEIERLRRDYEQEKAVTAFLTDPDGRVTILAGTEKSPKASGKMVWSPRSKKALFYAARLPVPPPGKVYQLWIIAANKPIDAGTFSVDPQGKGFLRVESLADTDKAQKFAVTVEPAGGVPQPTGEMHLLGSL